MKNDRISKIYEILKSEGSINADDLSERLKVSPATIRRDLQEMEDLKLIHRYYGGAVLNKELEIEPTMHAKHLINMERKNSIARYAASLIKNNDIVYIDAGTTTESMIDYIHAKNILVVTQALSIMQKLYEKQIKCYCLGGYIRFSTNIFVDNDTVEKIANMHFDISFLGVNAINPFMGFSTTNEIEAMLKKAVLSHSDTTYILADKTKFKSMSHIKFANVDQANIITDELIDEYDYSKFKEVIPVCSE